MGTITQFKDGKSRTRPVTYQDELKRLEKAALDYAQCKFFRRVRTEDGWAILHLSESENYAEALLQTMGQMAEALLHIRTQWESLGIEPDNEERWSEWTCAEED